MNDLNRNTRTLIVCFVIGVFSLIPLRFYEVGTQVAEESQILGTVRNVEVIMPDSELRSESVPVLEFPYEEVESGAEEEVNCLTQQEADRVVGGLTEILKTPGLDSELVTAVMEEIASTEARVCR